jgi:hypothetical protein
MAIAGDNTTLLSRIQHAINEFLQWLKATVFGDTEGRLDVFAKKTLRELLNGKEISLPNGRNNSVSLRGILNEKGEINYEQLRQTTDAIEEGAAHLNRLSLAEERGRTKGGRRNVEASLVLGGWENTFGADTQERGGSQSTQDKNDARKRQEQLLEKWARETAG